MKLPFHLGILILLFFSVNALAQTEKQIFGDTVVLAGVSRTYSLDAKLAHLEWKILPPEAGMILSHDQNTVTVHWSYHSLAGTLSSSLCVFINYPNAEYSYNYFLPVKVIPYVPDTNLKAKNSHFSRTSKDSLRFWFKFLCDTGNYSRVLQLKDSSSKKVKGQTTQWHFISVESKKEITAQGARINIRLNPDKYIVNLLQQTNGETIRLADTLVVPTPPIPGLNISSQTPCAGTPACFSIGVKNKENCAHLILEYGDGDYSYLPPATGQALHIYHSSDELIGIFMSTLTAVGKYGCAYKTKELAVSPRKNQFTVFNARIEPGEAKLNKVGEKVELKCQMGFGLNPGNPNSPFTYLWNTGQKTPTISVSEPGSFSLVVKDKLGCSSPEIGPVHVRQNFKIPGRPVITGPSEIKAGEKAEYKINKAASGLCQFKFIFNDVQSFVTEPSIQTSVTLPDWERSQSGKLKVIGIHLKPNKGYHSSYFSDTLLVEITK